MKMLLTRPIATLISYWLYCLPVDTYTKKMQRCTLIRNRLLKLFFVALLLNPLIAAAVSDSDRLFDYAEQHYPQYFSPSGATTFPIDRYLARYYPGTDTYVGTFDKDVYVYGNVFGGLVKVGRISDFITLISRIDNLSPSQASSGTEITVTGEDFTQTSKVKIGDQTIAPQFVSENQLRFVVPFSLNQNSALIPLQPGQYAVQVDGSNAVNLTAVDLPINPAPPGQLLNDNVHTAFQALSQSLPEFKALLPQLLQQTQNEPNTQRIIQGLAEIANGLSTQAEPILYQLIAQMDSQSLDTLERTLYASEQSAGMSQQSLISVTQKSLLTNTGSSEIQPAPIVQTLNGDSWLLNRKGTAQAIRLLKKVESVTGSCFKMTGSLLLEPSPAAAIPATCLALELANLIPIITVDIIETTKQEGGAIKAIQLHISSFGGSDGYLTAGTTAENEKINLHINNADNNKDNPSPQAKNIISATLSISHIPDMGQISSDVLSMTENFTKIRLTGNDFLDSQLIKLKNLFHLIDHAITQPTETREISPANISSALSGASGSCDISPYVKTNSDLSFVVPDLSSSVADATKPNAGSCDFKINEGYRMPWENKVLSTIDFSVKKYPKMTVSVTGGDSVTYSRASLSGHTSCTSANSPCTEYFDIGPSTTQINLTAFKSNGSLATSLKWSGTGMSTVGCTDNNPSCAVNLDITNIAAPNISETNSVPPPPPIIVGTWNSQFDNGRAFPVDLGGGTIFYSRQFTFSSDGVFCQIDSTSDGVYNNCGPNPWVLIKTDPYSYTIDWDLPNSWCNFYLTWAKDHWVMDTCNYYAQAIKTN